MQTLDTWNLIHGIGSCIFLWRMVGRVVVEMIRLLDVEPSNIFEIIINYKCRVNRRLLDTGR